MYRALFFIFIALAGCSKAPPSDAYIGYVEAEYVYVSAPQAGWLEALPMREGMQVTPGDILFELDKDQQHARVNAATGRVLQADAQARDISTGARPEEIKSLEAKLAEANAMLTKAKSDRARFMPLVAEGIESKTTGDQVQSAYLAAIARVTAAQEAIKIAHLGGRDPAREAAAAVQTSTKAAQTEAEWALRQRSVTAKVSGRIEAIYHRPGEYVTPGTPVVALLPDQGLKIRFFVPQAELPNFTLGQIIQISPDHSAQATPATISFIATEAEFTPPVIYSKENREKLVFLIEARLPTETNLRPGLPVDVSRP